MIKYSKQRELIYETVLNNRTHPTADFVYNNLKINHPGLSLGTVYRNLQHLSDSGKILKLNIPGKADRYDGDLSPHYHTVCEKCGEVGDIFIDYIKDIDKLVETKAGVKVNSHNIIFNITCEKCNCNRLNEAI